jgi:hypothetical protein
MPGQRPDTRIVLKPKKGEGTITLASFWTDGDRPSGGLDRRIKRLKVELEDGTVLLVINSPKEATTHYCNLFRDQPGNDGGGRGRGNGPPRTEPEPPPFDDSDLPF